MGPGGPSPGPSPGPWALGPPLGPGGARRGSGPAGPWALVGPCGALGPSGALRGSGSARALGPPLGPGPSPGPSPGPWWGPAGIGPCRALGSSGALRGSGPAGPWDLVGHCGDRALSGPNKYVKTHIFNAQRHYISQTGSFFIEKTDFQRLDISKTQKKSV